MHKNTSRKLLILIVCLVALPVLAVCCLGSVIVGSLFFTQRSVAQTSNQPVSPYIAVARQEAINVGIPPDLFVRQINQESGFNPRALSPSGAEGIAQFMPDTAASLGIDPWNPKEALRGAAQLMAHYAKMFDGTYAKALATYNAGAGTVQHAIDVCGEAHWMDCLLSETQQYINIIMG
ncbi:MAG TPA: lytic transglycosylase domain-containing protein [Ktedonobacteraceae bacterium]|nr:lytic transglycosylase domain-containing protein [Ktedonobacteraceae bacterium]